jgi:hypothetical protein
MSDTPNIPVEGLLDENTLRPMPKRTPSLMRWLTGRWSPLCCIDGNAPGTRWSDLCNPDGPGVYRLVALDPNDVSAPSLLGRVCGNDPSGTLYIGCATWLRRRLGQLGPHEHASPTRTVTQRRAYSAAEETLSSSIPCCYVAPHGHRRHCSL